MTTREQVRADTALIERLTAELAAERAKREEADSCYDDLRREVERLRLVCAEHDRLLALERSRAEAAEARVRALEAIEREARFVLELLSGSGETAKAPPAAEPECPDCGGGLWLGSVTLGTIRACPRCLPQDPAQSTDGREG